MPALQSNEDRCNTCCCGTFTIRLRANGWRLLHQACYLTHITTIATGATKERFRLRNTLIAVFPSAKCGWIEFGEMRFAIPQMVKPRVVSLHYNNIRRPIIRQIS